LKDLDRSWKGFILKETVRNMLKLWCEQEPFGLIGDEEIKGKNCSRRQENWRRLSWKTSTCGGIFV
jgi:hypothetical protein